jgi:WS/DGAT/MGAT family acyltransferase
MHIGTVQILDVLPQRREHFFRELKELVRSRSHLLPYLTHRVKDAPLQIDHPSWVACDVDYDAHIERVLLPPPGDMRTLEQTVAELHARLLDRSRPLWKMYYIEGLANGQTACFNVVHHACVDGLSGQLAINALTDATPDGVDATHLQSPTTTDAHSTHPRSGERLLHAIDTWVHGGIESIAATARGIDAFARLGTRLLAAPTAGPTAAWRAPATPLNRAIGATRGFAALRISLTDVKAIGKARGCSANDVFLAICGAALRAYLSRNDALPSTSLIAGVPVSVRRPDDLTMNTQVALMRVALGTRIDDPVARLTAIHAAAAEARSLVADLAAVLPSNPRFLGMPWLERGAARLWELSGAANVVPPPINLIISNVPGPRAIRYLNGARVLTLFPVSIPAHGSGMNITAHSYAEYFEIGVTVCAETVPDIELFRDDLLRAYVDLRARVLQHRYDERVLQREHRNGHAERRWLTAGREVA